MRDFGLLSIRLLIFFTTLLVVVFPFSVKAETETFVGLGAGVHRLGYDFVIALADGDSTFTEFDGENGLALSGELAVSPSQKWDIVFNFTGFSSDLRSRVGRQQSALWKGSGNIAYRPLKRIWLSIGGCGSLHELSYRFHADSTLSASNSGFGVNLSAGYEIPIAVNSALSLAIVWSYQKFDEYRIIAYGAALNYRLHFKMK